MSGLQLTFTELRRQVSRFIGVGRVLSDYSGDASRLSLVDDAVLTGLRKFCWPVLDPREGIAHRWTFLDSEFTLDLVAGDDTYLLPAAYLRLTEPFSYPEGSEKRSIMPVDYNYIRSLRSMDDKEGDPIYSAIRQVDGLDGATALHQVVFYPRPAEAMTLTYSCEIGPYMPTSSDYDSSVPFGGPMHAETIIHACLVAAEEKAAPESGAMTHRSEFERLLLASIEIDRQEAEERAASMLWPVDALSGGVTTLSVTKSQLERLIGRELGYPPHPKTWHHGQASTVAEVLRNGLRKFYQPMVLPGEMDSHSWSFVNPVHKMNLVSGIRTYELPEDYSVLNGRITYAELNGAIYSEIVVIPEEDVRWRLQSESTSTRPEFAAIRVKQRGQVSGTRYEISFAPIPSEDVQIEIPYSINADQLGTDQSLPMGGQPHAQTIIEACLAAAEIQMKTGNIHQQEFERCLQSSVSHDRKHSPNTLGYSYDRSDFNDDYYTRRRSIEDNPLTVYNGTFGTWP